MINQIEIVILISIVAVISLTLFIIGILGYKRVRDIRLLSVTLAFGVFFIKNILTAMSLLFNIINHGELELFGAIFDFIAMSLLLIPVLKKKKPVLID